MLEKLLILAFSSPLINMIVAISLVCCIARTGINEIDHSQSNIIIVLNYCTKGERKFLILLNELRDALL